MVDDRWAMNDRPIPNRPFLIDHRPLPIDHVRQEGPEPMKDIATASIVLSSLVLNAMIGAIIPLVVVKSIPLLRFWAMGNDPPVTRGFEGVWRLKSGEPM